MFEGELIGIFTAGQRGDPLHLVGAIEAVAGRGLVGDRYFVGEGRRSSEKTAEREVTLIESEALEGLTREYGITLEPHEARRNLLTVGVPLNHLVGRAFRVGEVVLRGMLLCEPCGHLEKLTSQKLRKGLAHRGGLRAQIVHGGMLRIGDAIRLHDAKAGRGATK